jgi:hypothetical protein
MTGPMSALELPWRMLGLGIRAERRAREAVSAAVSRAVLDGVDALIGSRLAEDVADHVLERLFTAGGIEGMLARAEDAEVPQRVADQLLAAGIAEQIATRVVDGPELERIVAAALESEVLWILVDEIARSPAVTDAISHQGLGLADEVAGVVRERSLRADARLERVARRLLRRGSRDRATVGPATGAKA